MPQMTDGLIQTDNGVLLPPGAKIRAPVRKPGKKLSKIVEQFNSIKYSKGFNAGYPLERDQDTLIIKWCAKGSGEDDKINACIAEGNIGNVGVSPVIVPEISGIINRHISQASAAILNIQGKKTPAKKALDAIARFNDSPLGITDGIKQIVYQLQVYNRGAPVSTVPIVYPTNQWEENGLEAIPIDKNLFYLQVDWTKHGTPVPFLPSVFLLQPTGNNEWPYWYGCQIDNKLSWVLLHNTHIIPNIPGYSSQFGIGTSPVYICLGFIGSHALVIEERTERQVATQPDGILAINGTDQDASQIQAELDLQKELQKEHGTYFDGGYAMLASEETISFESFRFRQPDGISFTDWRQWTEDVIALAFQEWLGAVVTRGGIGFGVQSQNTSEAASDAGVNAVLHRICTALSAIYPKVTFTLNRSNDVAQQKKLSNFKEFSSALNQLHSSNKEELILTRDEVRAYIDQNIFPIPETGEDIVSVDSHEDPDKAEESSDTRDEQNQDVEKIENEIVVTRIWYKCIKQFSSLRFTPVEDLQGLPEFEEFISLILTALEGQTASLDVIQLIEDLEDSEDLDEILGLVEERMDLLVDHIDEIRFKELMIFFAELGRDFMINQANTQGVDPEESELAAIDSDIEGYVDDRFDQLFISATGTDSQPDIFDPQLQNTLDAESVTIMGSIIHGVLTNNPDIDPPQANTLIQSEAASRNQTRAVLIADNEGSRSHGYGSYTTASTLNGQTKTWLVTTSANPRPTHLADVGITIPFNDRFPHGGFWSQEEVNCKCGVQVEFPPRN